MEVAEAKKRFSLYTLALIAILLFALILRLKYFNLGQPLWYDEAEYLSIAKNWAYNVPYEFPRVRPVLFPLVVALLYKIHSGSEFIFRLIELLFSVGGVFLTYLLGKELYNRKIGLMAAFLMSVFYLHIFFSARILVDMPSMAMYTLVAYLFWRGHVKKKSKPTILLMGILLGLGILLRFPVGIVAFVFLFFLLFTEKLKFVFDRHLWLSAFLCIAILLPYFIWFYFKFNQIAIISISYGKGLVIWDYIRFFPTYLHSPLIPNSFFHVLILLFLFGLIVLLANIILGFDLLTKEKKLKSDLFLLFLILFPFIYFGYFIHMEPRYMFYIFPGVFIVIGIALLKIYGYIAKYNKAIAISFVFIVLLFSGYHQIKFADFLIKSKENSYIQFKQAGLWLKEYSERDDVIISDGAPQLTYYSERKIIGWGKEEDFLTYINEVKPRYMILSVLEKSPDWAYAWPQENTDKVKPVQAFYADQQKEQPILVIYGFIGS